MAEISAGQVKVLRQRTGAGMMDCKKALIEAEGDLERASDVLRERGLLKARKRLGRETLEGRVEASLTPDRRRGALVELNCETDFVAKTDEFVQLAQSLAKRARDAQVQSVAELLAERDSDASLGDRVESAIAKLGENVQVRRVVCFEAPEGGRISSYIHAGGKIGVMVETASSDPGDAKLTALAHNLCMHVAAANPIAVSRDEIPARIAERERKALEVQAAQEGKPAHILEKMIDGRMGKFFREVALLEQPLVMDPDRSVGKALEEARASVTRFARFQLGDELEE